MADRQENELAHDHPLDMDPFQKGNVRYEKWITFVRDAEQRLALVSQGRSPDPSHHLQSLGKENELTETEAAEANARLTELLLSQTAPPLHERIIRRFDRLADEALETFFDGDLVLWKRIIERLGVAALTAAGEETFAHGPVKVPVEDLEPIKIFRGRISEQQRFWEDLAKERAENANLPQRRWSIQCNDQLALETRRERFEQLAEHAVSVELGISFDYRFQAADAWLDLLQRERPHARKSIIRAICIASAEYCAELKIRALKAGNGASAEVLSEVERQFRALASSIAVESPRADLYAIHRGIVDTLPCTEATRIVTVEPTAERSPQQVSVGRDEADEKERAIGSEQPTLSPVEGREQRLQRFITAHSGATLANIKYSAAVFTSDFQKWRKGELKPDSVMSGRIEDVLTGRQPLLKKLRKQRTD